MNNYQTEPLTFQQLKEILRLECDLKKELIEFEKTFMHPNSDTYEMKDIKDSARKLEKYFKEQMNLDKRRTHDPSYRVAFLLYAGDKPVTGDRNIDKEIRYCLNLLPGERPEVLYSIYNVFKTVITDEQVVLLDKLCKPLMKQVLDEKEQWETWDVFPNLPVAAAWMELDRIAFTEEVIAVLNKRIKNYYETVHIKSLAGMGQPLGRTNSMVAIAQIVAKEVYGESTREQEAPASYLNQLKSEAYEVVKDQKLYDQAQILPIMELHHAYGILHD